MAEGKQIVQSWEPRNKFSAGDLGDAKQVHKLEDGDKTVMLLGTVYGKVTGMSYKFNPNNPEDPSIALNGIFEAVPADTSRSIIRAPRFFPPNAVAKLVAQAIVGDKSPDGISGLQRGKSVDIAAEGGMIPLGVQIGVRKTGTAIGYEYVCEIAGDKLVKEDILADVRGQLQFDQRSRPALPPAGQKALAAPKGKGKKK